MKFRKLFFILILLPLFTHGQKGFHWNSDKSKIDIPFQHVYNLVIIPVEINGVKLSMLLDTGAESSLIFSLPENDSIEFYNPKKIHVKGLGSEEIIEALQSENNNIKISGYEDDKFPLLIVLNQNVNFSSRLGIPVNGILGYSFFKHNIVEINYQKKIVTIHKERDFLAKKKIKKYLKHPISIINQRPYIDVESKIDSDTLNLKLLIDIGLGDGLWLFEDERIKSGNVFFEDVLGRGLSGEIIGKKSRIKTVKIANFRLNEPLVSYPYRMYLPRIGIIQGRNGSVGGEILSRFNIIIDYKEKFIYLKKNSRFGKPFNYNMSGIEIEHNGIEYVQETLKMETSPNYGEQQGEVIYKASDFKYKFSLKPVFQIATVRKDSPAALVGILPGDKIVKINKKSIHQYTIQKINELLQSEDGKWVRIDIERKSKPMEFKFQLKKIL